MATRRTLLILSLLTLLGPVARADEKEEPARKGTVVGVVTDRGKNYVDIKADGEEKARRYHPHFPGEPRGTDKATLELMPKIEIGTRVRVEWLYAERFRIMKMEVLKKEK